MPNNVQEQHRLCVHSLLEHTDVTIMYDNLSDLKPKVEINKLLSIFGYSWSFDPLQLYICEFYAWDVFIYIFEDFKHFNIGTIYFQI